MIIVSKEAELNYLIKILKVFFLLSFKVKIPYLSILFLGFKLSIVSSLHNIYSSGMIYRFTTKADFNSLLLYSVVE